MLGKLSRLPGHLREQLNLRLANCEAAKTLLPWLNSLPELQAIIKERFNDEPVSEQNLSEYRQHSFRKWETRQAALEFCAEAQADAPSGQSQLPVQPIVNQLVHWISLRFAAAAHNSTIPADAETELRQIRQFLNDILALRRGDLSAQRIQLEQQRLSLEQSKNKDAIETLFWEWSKRPDIQARLYPHRDPDKIRRDTVRLIDSQFLGIRHPEDDTNTEPALLI
jgi:hypothetical protein